MSTIGKQVFYEGRVQGVGFRYTVRHLATGYDVVGWVKNLSDGRVELQVSGEEEELIGFLQAIRDSELGSYIRKEDVHAIMALKDARGFEITF